MPRALWRPCGGGLFLMSEAPLYPQAPVREPQPPTILFALLVRQIQGGAHFVQKTISSQSNLIAAPFNLTASPLTAITDSYR